MLRGSVPSGSGSSHTFAKAPQATMQRSAFNRSHGVKTTFDAGYLVPILVDEMVPGDTFHLKMSAFARLATPLFPLMDNMYMETFFFSVPYRLVWDNWQRFNGEQRNPGDSTDYIVPTITMPADTGAAELSLSDYFGIPTKVPSLQVNSLHYRAYNLIYNEWFRDQNLQNSAVVDVDDGPDDYSDYVLLRRGKRHDYFTSCLPFPQKGPDVTLPFGSTAPVIGDGVTPFNGFYYSGSVVPYAKTYADVIPATAAPHNLTAPAASNPAIGAPQGFYVTDVAPSGMIVDLSQSTAVTINELRLAFQTQRMYEKDARGGSRYTEIIRSHFNVVSPDARQMRPEYIGGGSTPVVINPVAQTSATSGSNALGDLAAYGVCAPHGHGFTYSATEHCLILGLVSVRADLNYQQGLSRMWSRQTRFDFYWPSFAHLGEQAVLNKEIFAQGTSADDEVFGYQERYAEYRYKPSVITGRFRSNATQSLDAWHLAQDFASLPTLNSEFIVEDPPNGSCLSC